MSDLKNLFNKTKILCYYFYNELKKLADEEKALLNDCNHQN